MKNYFKHTIALLFVSCFTFTSCLDLTSNATDAEASVNQTVQKSTSIDVPLVVCDFDSRKTTDNVVGLTGVVKRMNAPSGSEEALYVIQSLTDAQRFVACNMPEEAKVDGMRLTIDAEVKEIYPEEKWIATPMKLLKVYDMVADEANEEISPSSI